MANFKYQLTTLATIKRWNTLAMLSIQNLAETYLLAIHLDQDHRSFSIEALDTTGRTLRLTGSNSDLSPIDVTIGGLHVRSNFRNGDNIACMGELAAIGWHQDRLIIEGDFGDISLKATNIDVEQVLPYSAEGEDSRGKHGSALPHMRKLLTVHDCIEVRNRGLMLVGLAEDDNAVLSPKQTFTLVTKDGAHHSATAIGVEHFNMQRSEVVQTGVLVAKDLANVGWLHDAEIWVDR